MPELPDVTVYVEHLERRLRGASVIAISIRSPNLLRTFDPPLAAATGTTVRGVQRLGKRIVCELSGDLYLVLHLMIEGRRVQGVVGTLVPKLARGNPAELRIDEWQQLIERGSIAATPIAEERRDVVRRSHWSPFSTSRIGPQDSTRRTGSQAFVG